MPFWPEPNSGVVWLYEPRPQCRMWIGGLLPRIGAAKPSSCIGKRPIGRSAPWSQPLGKPARSPESRRSVRRCLKVCYVTGRDNGSLRFRCADFRMALCGLSGRRAENAKTIAVRVTCPSVGWRQVHDLPLLLDHDETAEALSERVLAVR